VQDPPFYGVIKKNLGLVGKEFIIICLYYHQRKKKQIANLCIINNLNIKNGYSHRQKRMKQIKKMIQRGLHDPNKDDPFELFISSTDIRYCYYKDTQKILGNTFGMCILQDFEAITPNLLARTIETVEGGGVIVLLLRTMNSLQQLYTMTMVKYFWKPRKKKIIN